MGNEDHEKPKAGAICHHYLVLARVTLAVGQERKSDCRVIGTDQQIGAVFDRWNRATLVVIDPGV